MDWFLLGVLVFFFVTMMAAVGYFSRRYYGLRERYEKLEWQYAVERAEHSRDAGELALEIHRNNVLADRAEVAEKKLAFDEKTIDSLLLVPQGRCHDGALRRPTVAVIRDGEGQA